MNGLVNTLGNAGFGLLIGVVLGVGVGVAIYLVSRGPRR